MNVGGIVVVPEIASWWISGGGWAADVEIGVPLLSMGSDAGISLGGGGMQLDVKSRRQPDHVSYRMSFLYGELEVGLGGSIFGNVSITGGAPDLPAGGTPVMRNVGAPDDSGANGPPTGFLGPAYTLSVNAGIGNAGAAGLIMMNPSLPRWSGTISMASFKYVGGYGGFSIGGSASFGGALQTGLVAQIDKMHGGRPTNQRVTRRGLVSGAPFMMRLNPFR